MKAIILFLSTCLILSCTQHPKQEQAVAGLPFDVTGSQAAMPYFEKGHLLLHNFEYYDAAEAFVEAQKIDSTFVMAYWGEAMSYNHPVWNNVNLEKGRKALKKLGSTPAIRQEKARTDLEKDFMQSVELLYGEGSKTERDLAHAEYMEKMYARYPGNHEVSAFYALALLGIKKDWRNWEKVNEQAAEISKAILAENPNHPGALHYLIHSDDHPEYAKNALNAANSYSKVASYAGHALHMPSHIYLALGMWDDVVSSNEVAWQAGVDRVKAKSLDNDELNYHSHLWLLYGYLQQGRNAQALELLKNQNKYTIELPSARARFHLLKMKGHYLFETGDWSGEAANIKAEIKDLSLESRSASYLVDGATAFNLQDEAAMLKVIQASKMDLLLSEQLASSNQNITICGSTYSNNIPSEYEIKNAKMIHAELEGLLAWMKQDLKGAEELFRKAVEIDESFVTGPPDFSKLSNEFLGEFLLAVDKPEEAYEQFQKALQLSPNRLISLRGQLKAAKQIGNAEKVKELQNRIETQLNFKTSKVQDV